MQTFFASAPAFRNTRNELGILYQSEFSDKILTSFLIPDCMYCILTSMNIRLMETSRLNEIHGVNIYISNPSHWSILLPATDIFTRSALETNQQGSKRAYSTCGQAHVAPMGRWPWHCICISQEGPMNLIEDKGQGQRSFCATHPLMLVFVCAKYGNNLSRTICGVGRTQQDVPCGPDAQMTMKLHIYRSRRFQWFRIVVNLLDGYWMVVLTRFQEPLLRP